VQTIVVAVLGVFILITLWSCVELLARKHLGERPRGCRAMPSVEGGGGGSSPCAACQSIDTCPPEKRDRGTCAEGEELNGGKGNT